MSDERVTDHPGANESAHRRPHLSNLSGKRLSDAVLHHRRFKGTDFQHNEMDIRHYKERRVRRIVLRGLLAIMRGGWDVHVSSVRAGRSRPGGTHPRGIAVDLNNYGPDGAKSRIRGTSSPNPTDFVRWLKRNRKALGNILIGGGVGANHKKWGTDFPDADHHIHIDWRNWRG